MVPPVTIVTTLQRFFLTKPILYHWIGSRCLIAIAVLGIAPLVPGAACVGWGVNCWRSLLYWDSASYLRIAEQGYGAVGSSLQPIVAFFPGFSLWISGLTRLGVAADVAGVINLAFLLSLLLFQRWVKGHYGQRVANWAGMALVWCPFSLFGTVVYTEGLFLLWSTLALSAFEARRYWLAGLWGALASGTF